MENYKEKYKDALERASKLRVQNPFDTVGQMVEHIFPELKENEDDRMRKALKQGFFHYGNSFTTFGGINVVDIIAWLEKQDFHYSFEIKAGHWYKCVCDYMLNGSHLMFKNDRLYYCRRDWRLEGEIDERNVKNIGVNGYKSFFRPATNQEIKDWLEKQGENKPTDKVEPKFKPGDWIVFNGLILHIDEVVNGYYRTTSRGDGIHNSYDWDIDNAARLWTIQDAKDGDVLASEDKDKIFLYNGKLDLRGRACAYCGIYKTYDGLRFAKCTVGNYFTYKEPCPTTKEQRDTLFAKMADAGYEWDSEKKELRKIEQKKVDADKVINWVNPNKVINWVNPNKVIEWLKNTIKETEEYLGEYGEYYDTHLTLPYDSIEDLIDDFKKNFKL